MPASLVGAAPGSQAARASARWAHVAAPPGDANDRMAHDASLIAWRQPAVSIYAWGHAAVTFGRSQRLPGWVRVAEDGARVDAAVRPTGGGMAVHGSDVCLAAAVPREGRLQVHRLLSAACLSAVHLCRSLGLEAKALVAAPAAGRVRICLTDPSPYAVMLQGKKVAGFALRRYPDACLIQGSLLVAPIAEALRRALPARLRADLAARSISLQEAAGRVVAPERIAEAWTAGWDAWWIVPEACNGGKAACDDV